MPSRKGSRNKKTLATEAQRQQLIDQGVDPKDYIVSCLADPENFNEIKFRAAETLMEYYYAKLSRMDVTALHGFKKGASLTVNLTPKPKDAD